MLSLSEVNINGINGACFLNVDNLQHCLVSHLVFTHFFALWQLGLFCLVYAKGSRGIAEFPFATHPLDSERYNSDDLNERDTAGKGVSNEHIQGFYVEMVAGGHLQNCLALPRHNHWIDMLRVV